MLLALLPMVALPVVGALLSLSGRREFIRWGSVAVACATFLCSLVAVFSSQLPVTFSSLFRLDAMGGVFLLTTCLLYGVAAIYAGGYVGPARTLEDRQYVRRFYALLHLFGFTLIMVPLINNMAVLWIAIELTTITSALLVAIEDSDVALEAAWKYALIASAGLALALIGVVVLYMAGSAILGPSYEPNWTSLVAIAPHLSPGLTVVSLLFVVAGFGTKVGFVPMHTWLPDAHSEAPSPVSALLSGALLASALYGVLRFATITERAAGHVAAQHIFLIFGLLSLLAASFFVLRQNDFKRLLAYSSIEHMGILALAAAFGTPLALYGLFLHVMTHGSAKSLAFFSAGSVLRRYGTKEIAHIRSVIRSMPWTGLCLICAVLAIGGLPPFGTFRSELLIIIGGFSSPIPLAAGALLILVNLAFLGVTWAGTEMAFSQPGRDIILPKAGEVSPWIVTALAIDLFFLVTIGLYVPAPLAHLLHTAVAIMEG
ncbi:MAG: NADH dehydrogenase FAD-containing subunit [Chloroflexi bacterium]|nr:NADH dehydrogenase FAD-containing subunit [Chloroflexota bacterium]